MTRGRIKRVVGFSGGIDSQAAAKWCRQRYAPEDVILLNSNAGRNEHPLTEAFIEQYSREVFPVISVTSLVKDMGTRGTAEGATRDRRQEFSDEDELTFDRLAYIKGRFPSRTAQFCTEHLKLAPQRRWCEENLRGVPFARYIGVRKDESVKRRCAAAEEFNDYFGCKIYRPVLDWTKERCFEFCADEPINPLYKLGFNRVGCAPCINSGKDDIREWAARFPEMIDKIRRWEQSVGRTFFAPRVPGLEINWIDEVVAWSRTARGGRQPLLSFVEADADNYVCVSKYGLCE